MRGSGDVSAARLEHGAGELERLNRREDWTAWLAERCGPLVAPPPVEPPEMPKLADAPGTYVHEA